MNTDELAEVEALIARIMDGTEGHYYTQQFMASQAWQARKPMASYDPPAQSPTGLEDEEEEA
jgi:hypothetical protein